jgi:spermidine synthase
VVLGDARLSLEREPPQEFDLLVLDAFSSDSIPVHLLTREAFEVYARHVKPDGVIAVHLTNLNFDFVPVVRRQGKDLGWSVVPVRAEPEDGWDSDWVLVTRSAAVLANPKVFVARLRASAADTSSRPWTDDYTNLMSCLK